MNYIFIIKNVMILIFYFIFDRIIYKHENIRSVQKTYSTDKPNQ